MATVKDTYEVDSKADTGGIRQAVGQLVSLRGALNGIKSIGAAPFRAIGGAIKAVGGGLGVLGLAVGGLKAAAEIVGKVTGALKEASPAFGSALGRIEERFTNFKDILFRNIGDALAPVLEKVADLLSSPAFTEFFNRFSGFVFGALKAATPILDTIVGAVGALIDLLVLGHMEDFAEAMEEAFGPEIGGVITAIIGGIKGVVDLLATGDWEQFRSNITNALGGQEPGNTIVNTIQSIVAFVQENWPKVQAAFEQVAGKIGEILGAVTKIIGDFIAEHGPEIQAFLQNVVGKVGEILGRLFQVVMTILGGVKKFIDDNQEEIKRIIETVWNIIKTSVETVLNAISGIINAVLLVLQGDWQGAWDQIKAVFEGVWNGFVGIIESVWSLIKGVVAGGINAVVDLINGLINEVNKALIWANQNLGTSFKGIDYLARVSFAQGGIVSSPTAAIVGDNPRSPEVVAPLSDLLPMIQQAVAGGGQIVVNVYGPFGPGYTPYEAGQQAGQGIRDKLRAKGRV